MLALLSAGLQVLVFPHFNLFFLCWIAVVPLLYALLRGRGGEGELFDSEGRSLRPFTLQQGFLLGWLTGIVWYVGTCYWIYPVMHGYGNLAAPVAALITATIGTSIDVRPAALEGSSATGTRIPCSRALRCSACCISTLRRWARKSCGTSTISVASTKMIKTTSVISFECRSMTFSTAKAPEPDRCE